MRPTSPSPHRRAAGATLALAALVFALAALPPPCPATAAPGAACPLMKSAKAIAAPGGGCPMPREAMSCCGGDGAPPAAADPVATVPEPAPAALPVVAAPAAAPLAAPAPAVRCTAPPAADPVPLYTLHASLLI